MAKTCFTKFEGKYYPSLALTANDTLSNLTSTSKYLSMDIDEAKIMISTSLTLLTGIFHVNFFKYFNIFILNIIFS